MAIEAVATRAVLSEEFRSLRERIFAQQCERTRRRNTLEARELHDPLGLTVGGDLRHLERGVGAILRVRQPREDAEVPQPQRQHAQVEAMAELPVTDQRHRHDEANHHAGQNHGAPHFEVEAEEGLARREIFQQLEEEHEIPLGPRRLVLLGGIGR